MRLVIFAIPVLLVLMVAIAVIADRRRTPGGAAGASRFLRAHGALDTADAVTFAAGYLSRRSSLRWASAVIAVIAVNVVGFVVTDEPIIRIDLFPIMGAYAVGTVLAELRLARARGTVARASLTARTVEQYLGPTWLRVQRVATAAAGLLMAAAMLVDPGPARSWSAVESGLYALAALLVGVGAEWAQRRIVGQPQPGAAPDLLAADDAVRTSSVHAVAGVAIAFLVMTVAAGTAVLAENPAPMVVGVILGLFLWYRCAAPSGASRRIAVIAFALLLAVAGAGTGAVLLMRSASVSESQPGVPVPPAVEPTTAEPAPPEPTTPAPTSTAPAPPAPTTTVP